MADKEMRTGGGAAASWLAGLIEGGTLAPCRSLVMSTAMTDEIVTLARHGFDVKTADADKDAVKRLKQAVRAAGVKVDVLPFDLFRTRASLYGSVELIVDRVRFETLDPIDRAAWAHLAARFLPQGGRLAGWFPVGRVKSGPPFAVSTESLRFLLGRHFVVESLEPAGAAPAGVVRPWRGLFRRK